MTDPSYWQASATLAAIGDDRLPTGCDVLVVGGGLLGVATAYFLARRGVDVVVLERETIGAGATARNAGIVGAGTAEAYPLAIERHGRAIAREIWQFTLDNRSLLRQVLHEEGIECDYREAGHLSLACSPEEWELSEQTSRLLREDGIPSEMLDHRELQVDIQLELTPSILGARFGPGDGQLHSAKFVYGLARAARARGARFVLGREARRLTQRGDGWEITVGDGDQRESISATRVVCALNAWLPRLLPSLTGSIIPVRGQVLATTPMPRYFHCGMSADSGFQYWQQLPDGRIVLGGRRLAVADQEIGYDVPDVRHEVQHALTDYLHSLFAGLPPFEVEHRWGGVMGFSRDALPLIGPVPDAAGLFVAGGFTGHGMPFGLRAGEQLALACVEPTPPAVLAPFRLDRPTLAGA